MKATAVSYKMDVNRKLMLQRKHKSTIEDDRPKTKSRKYNDSYLDFGSHLSCRMARKNLSVLFAERYWPVRACYLISLNVI